MGLRIAAAVAPATATIHCIQKRIIVRFGLCPQRRPYRQGCCKQFKCFFPCRGHTKPRWCKASLCTIPFFGLLLDSLDLRLVFFLSTFSFHKLYGHDGFVGPVIPSSACLSLMTCFHWLWSLECNCSSMSAVKRINWTLNKFFTSIGEGGIRG